VKRTAAAVTSFLLLMLVLAPAALAANGEGWNGKTSDKEVALYMFGVMAFFVLLVIIASRIQGGLEKRKARRRADLERLS
jgi:uncharacterized protein involved in response to NO